MSIAEKLTTIAENEQKIFEAGYNEGKSEGYGEGQLDGYNDGYDTGVIDGKQAVYKEMFDDYQGNGTRTSYSRGFEKWEASMFYPQHDIKLTGNNSYFMDYFGQTSGKSMNLKERLEECGVVLDTSKATNLSNAFYQSRISHIPTISFAGTNGKVIGAFASYRIESIEKIIFKKATDVPTQNIFDGATKLTDLRIEGVIFSDFNISHSPINAESAIDIIEHLNDYSGTDNEFAYTVSFSSTTKGYLEALGETAPNGMTWLMYAQSKGWNT